MVNYPAGTAPDKVDNVSVRGGVIRADGSLRSGSGFSVEQLQKGKYKVVFEEKPEQVLSVIANPVGEAEEMRNSVTIEQIGKNGFTYCTRKAVVRGDEKIGQAEPMAVSFTAIVR